MIDESERAGCMISIWYWHTERAGIGEESSRRKECFVVKSGLGRMTFMTVEKKKLFLGYETIYTVMGGGVGGHGFRNRNYATS